jgi:hypothetical protein
MHRHSHLIIPFVPDIFLMAALSGNPEPHRRIPGVGVQMYISVATGDLKPADACLWFYGSTFSALKYTKQRRLFPDNEIKDRKSMAPAGSAIPVAHMN